MAAVAEPGDAILLSGPIGAGKSHFCRSFIRSYFGAEIDVPSPTFTLIQSYGEDSDEIIHADLYRLSGPLDIGELGLFADAGSISLVEWAERLGPDAPADALRLTILPSAAGSDTRREMQFSGPVGWGERLAGILSQAGSHV